ncbi:MAG: VWA domain-containing protein [Clostridiales bacterium]|nr:VWA domain-containing protein [Clostridiales bacterium]
MKKSLFTVFLTLLILVNSIIFASAAEIYDIKTDLPDLTVVIGAESGTFSSIDKEKVKASLEGNDLAVSDIDFESKVIEWVVIVDTSQSVKSIFDSEKKAIAALYDSMSENDKMSLYTFDTSFKQVLKGNEKPEDAKAKINALTCPGLDTIFYDTIIKVTDVVEKSDSDFCVPVLFSDGVDTISKKSLSDAEKSLKENGTPISGFYPESLDAKKADSFNKLLKMSGGKAESFKIDNISSKLESLVPKTEEAITIRLTNTGSITANDAADLTIDLGDGNEIKKNISVPDWAPVTQPEETSAQPETTSVPDVTESTTSAQPVVQEEKSKLPIFVICALIILAVVVIVAVFIRKKKNPGTDDTDHTDDINENIKDKTDSGNTGDKNKKVKPDKEKIDKPGFSKIKRVSKPKIEKGKEQTTFYILDEKQKKDMRQYEKATQEKKTRKKEIQFEKEKFKKEKAEARKAAAAEAKAAKEEAKKEKALKAGKTVKKEEAMFSFTSSESKKK